MKNLRTLVYGFTVSLLLTLSPALAGEPSNKAASSQGQHDKELSRPAPQDTPALPSAGEKAALGAGLDVFALGMTEEEVRARGAQPTDNPEMLQMPIRWADADWTCVVQLSSGKTVAILLFADLSDALLEQVFGDLRDRGCMPVTVQPAMGHPDLYQLSAQGKTDEECWQAMRKRLGVFSVATEGACSVLFTSGAFFKELAATVLEPAREKKVLSGHATDAIYAVNIDKSSNKITYLVSKWGYMAR